MTAMLSLPVSSCLFLLFISSSLAAQHHRRHGHGALYPEAVNLASLSRGVSIWSNGTCGDRGPETYCKLRGSGCSVCDSTRSDKRHPAEYALDGDSSTWWQSSTLHASHKYHYVTITIDLKQVYQVLYVRIRSGNSPRPANWFVERSLDGQAFMPWQYFAASDDLCWARYGIKPSPPHPHRLASDSEVICTSAYSKVTPVEGGEMHVSLSAGRPGANTTSKDWIEFTKARYIRFRFQRLGSSKQRHNHEMSKRYYYSIRDILVQGRCLCHGHAQACRFDSLTKTILLCLEGNMLLPVKFT